MASYCSNCGNPVADGQICPCMIQQQATPYPTDPQAPQGYTPPPGYIPPQPGYGAPGAYNQPQHAYQQPMAPSTPSPAKTMFSDLKLVLGDFVKDPLNSASTTSKLSPATSSCLLGIEVLVFMIFLWCTVFSKLGDIPAEIIFKLLFIGAFEIAALFGCLFLMAKILGSKLPAVHIYSSVAISSIVHSAVTFVCAILFLLFGVDSFAQQIFIFSSIAAFVFSISLLGRNIYDTKIKSLNNLLIISIAYSVHIGIVYLVAENIVKGMVSGFLPF